MTVNGTGTGTFQFNIVDPKNQSSGNQYWFEEKKPGKYSEKLQFKTVSLSDCDPSQGKKKFSFSVNQLLYFINFINRSL
jgi:hypothetical protein